MNNWTLIFVASIASYVLRAIPVLIFHKLPIAADGLIYRFLNYAAFGVMGGIIYSALLGEAWYSNWPGHFEDHATVLKLATFCLAVLIAARFRGVFKTLFVCLSFFIAATYLSGA